MAVNKVALIVAFLYNWIKTTIMQFLQGFLKGLAISEDIVMALIGYYLATKKTGTWASVGTGLLFGAITQLGAQGGLGLGNLLGGGGQQQTQPAPQPRRPITLPIRRPIIV